MYYKDINIDEDLEIKRYPKSLQNKKTNQKLEIVLDPMSILYIDIKEKEYILYLEELQGNSNCFFEWFEKLENWIVDEQQKKELDALKKIEMFIQDETKTMYWFKKSEKEETENNLLFVIHCNKKNVDFYFENGLLQKEKKIICKMNLYLKQIDNINFHGDEL